MADLARYEILSEIGANHHAHVFCGYDTQGDRDVCVFELLEKFQKNPDRWNAIWQQILNIARVKHEYHVSVYDFDRDRRWVIVELMRFNASQMQSASIDLVRTTLYRCLGVLDQLHTAGFLHGDIRPANVLFDGDGRVKLSFSPGLYLGDQIPRREFGHAFLAPEIYDQERGDVGPQVDLFALGMTALAMLMGDQFAPKLLQGAKDEDLAWQRFHRDLQGAAPDASALAPQTPPDIAQVINRLIARRVPDRFATAKEALAMLQRPTVDATAPVHSLKPTTNSAGTKPSPQPQRPKVTAPAKVSAPNKRPVSAHPAWSREWINEQLGKPLVMGTVVGGIILATVLCMAMISILQRPKETEIAKNGETDKSKEESSSTKKVVQESNNQDSNPVLTEQPKEVQSKWQLPDEVKPIDPKDIDPATGLYNRVTLNKLNSLLKPEDTQLTFRLIPPKKEVTIGAADPLQDGELPLLKQDFDKPYYLAEFEVTRAQFRALVAGKTFPEEPLGHGDLPACGVTWDEVQQFLAALGSTSTFVLPKEHEWERAARGDNTNFPWGNEAIGPERCRLRFDPSQKLLPVTELAAGRSSVGIAHLIGNAAEWCEELYVPGHKESEKFTDGANQHHVIRGGSYDSPDSEVDRFCVTWRSNCPNDGRSDVGFRVLIRLSEKP